MDHRRALAALLILSLCAAAGPSALPLREARWIVPEARLAQLSTPPVTCLKRNSDEPVFGAVAFQDPLLLGGQAARAGISCASCHRGGRSNPAFVFPGISGAPGTADVTASLFSSHRGDGVFNPKRIPDLTFDAPKVSHTVPGVLEGFIRGLIVEEFDGAEPPPKLLESLAVFVRELDASACPKLQQSALDQDMGFYAMAHAATVLALDKGDRDTASAMIRAQRSVLGRIAERFRPSATLFAILESEDIALAGIEQRIREGINLPALSVLMNNHWRETDAWQRRLVRSQSRSLYNPKRLARALSESRTP